MAARIVKHWIFVMPSPNEYAWREEVRRLAAIANVPVQDWDGISELISDGIVLTSEPTQGPEGWMETAIMSSSSSSLKFLEQLGFVYTDAVRRVSQYLAYAVSVGYRDGTVVGQSGEVNVVIPELGTLSPDLAQELDEPVPPLSMLQHGSPVIGAKAMWPRNLFAFATYGQPLALNSSPEIDVTGRSRILIFGPQISLPPGNWTIRALLDFDPEGSKSRYFASWGTRDIRSEQLIDIDRPGRFDISMSAQWESCTEAEFIVCSREPLFTGRLRFHSAEVIFNGR